MSWTHENDLVYYLPKNAKKNFLNKIAIIDIDGTIITQKNGKIPHYPVKDKDSWIFLSNDVPDIIDELYYDREYTVVLLSNQSQYTSIVQEKIENVRLALKEKNGWSPIILIAKGKNSIYRKPNIESMIFLLNILDVRKEDVNKILICGDAVGENNPYPPYRWSNVDYQYYLNVKKDICDRTIFYEPKKLFPSNKEELLDEINQDVVIMMGNQGSGKSTFARELKERKGYEIIESDKEKTEKKMTKLFLKYVSEEKKVIIDATNPSVAKRKVWIDLANSNGLTSCIVWSIINGYSFNKYRENKIPDIAYNIYSKAFVTPDETEDGIKVYRLY